MGLTALCAGPLAAETGKTLEIKLGTKRSSGVGTT